MKGFYLSRKVYAFVVSVMMLFAAQSVMAQYVPMTFLNGSKTGNEGAQELLDQKTNTKWGQSFNPNDQNSNCYVIFKTDNAVVPVNYFLCIGTDTQKYPTRNWDTWDIYGANFENDADAVEGAEGWVLIDHREAEVLSTENCAFQDFKFNKADGTAYKYFYIKVRDNAQHGDVWTQMTEFGLCTSDDFKAFLNKETSVNEPLQYKILAGDRNNGDGEGLAKLFDGDYNTKWGNGLTQNKKGDTTNGAYFIVRTSRPICPSYYKLVTGTDNASWNNRNWRDWEIYAIAETDEAKITRAAEGWVEIDTREMVGKDVLPDLNSYEVYFDINGNNEQKYQYFKVEIHATFAGAGYMQMTEFALGDEFTLQVDINTIYNNAAAAVSMDIFAEKALLDVYAQLMEAVKAITKPADLGPANAKLTEQAEKINASATKYGNLRVAAQKAQIAVEEKSVNATALAYLTQYVGEEIAPCAEFPVGSYKYVQANRQLTGDEAEAEATRINAYINANTSVQVDPITCTYEALSGSGGFGGEEHDKLIDGDAQGTKWCTNSGDYYIVFKSSEPIKPTYYGLVTGGDTYSYPDRNWKDWDIYAADFDSDEEAERESDAWVLIDHKVNVGTDVLKTYNRYESYIDLSEPCTKDYQYFKIEVRKPTGLIQMNEFTFYNQGNFQEYKELFLTEVQDSLASAEIGDITEETMAYKPLVDEYLTAYAKLENAADAPSLTTYRNRLWELIAEIKTSVEKYTEYTDAVESYSADDFADYEQAYAWAQIYFGDEAVEPGDICIRGSKEYILQNRSLNNDEISAEVEYLESMFMAAIEPDEAGYIVLGGHTVSQWGDGHYKHIVDNSKDAEGKPNTKWGGEASADGNTYVIFRTIGATNPFFYTLTTGGDTYTYQGRNWKTWEIYGANFAGDGAATKDAEGWVLLDKKENVGQNRLHPENLTASYFGFNQTENLGDYIYYKVVVYAAYSGNAIQMQELRFGTEEEYELIKEQYRDEAEEFDYDVIAQQSLIDEYEGKISEIEESTNMEDLFAIHDDLDNLQKAITASAAVYTRYSEGVEDNKAFLEEFQLEESEALTVYQDYLDGDVEPNEVFANGSADYILENHVLADSVVEEEMVFMESLKKAAVAAGYVAGTDITSMIVNRNFVTAEQALDEEGNKLAGKMVAEGWNGYIFGSQINEAKTMGAAEFCNENSKFDVNQTLSGMKNGFYQIKLNAGFRPNGDINSFNYAAMAYANNVKTFVPAVREGMVETKEEAWTGNIADKEIYACDVDEPTGDAEVDSVVVGYVIWGIQGTINAILNNRYEISMVAEVTDGNLTFGIKNEGTTVGGDWLGAGNFRLTYLGETATEEAVAEAVAYNAARATTMTETYVIAEDAASQAGDFQKTPNFAASQKDALASIGSDLVAAGELFADIYATKAAYYDLCFYKDAVYNKWINHPSETLEDDAYEIVDALTIGSYDNAAAAKAAKAALLAKYPDYLEIHADGAVRNADFAEGEAFEYEITIDGNRPYVTFQTLYDKLNENETVLTFQYKSETAIEGGVLYFGTPALDTNHSIALPVLEAAADWTTVTVDITTAVKEWGFGNTDHNIRYDFVGSADANNIVLSIRNMIVNEAAVSGDLNGDDHVDASDIQVVLNDIAAGENNSAHDLNNDGHVDASDIQTILNIIAAGN